MRPLLMISLMVGSLGCADRGDLRLRVPTAMAGRAPGDAPTVAAARLKVTEEEKALPRAETQLLVAEGLVATAKGAAGGGAELNAVNAARLEQARAQREWRMAGLELVRRRVLAAQSLVELATAELLHRAGYDLDPAPFRGQRSEMLVKVDRAEKRLVALHAARDDRERALAQAKERYALTVRASALAPPAAPIASASLEKR